MRRQGVTSKQASRRLKQATRLSSYILSTLRTSIPVGAYAPGRTDVVWTWLGGPKGGEESFIIESVASPTACFFVTHEVYTLPFSTSPLPLYLKHTGCSRLSLLDHHRLNALLHFSRNLPVLFQRTACFTSYYACRPTLHPSRALSICTSCMLRGA